MHETTYKKLTGSVIKTSTTELNKKLVISSLECKKIPSTFSYDIYASRVSNGLGGVVYFSNSNLSSAYDGMAGLTISY